MLAGWLFRTFFIFRYIGNNHPNWLSYFSQGLKPPTRYSRYVSGNRVYIAMGMGIQWGDLQGSGLDFGHPAGGGGPWRIDRCATRMFDAWMCVDFVIIHVSFLPMFMLVMSFFFGILWCYPPLRLGHIPFAFGYTGMLKVETIPNLILGLLKALGWDRFREHPVTSPKQAWMDPWPEFVHWWEQRRL